MSKLVAYLRSNPELVLQLHHAIRCELESNLGEKRDLLKRLQSAENEKAREVIISAEGFNEDECKDTIVSIEDGIKKCQAYEAVEDDRCACCGDSIIGRLVGGRRLDVIAIVSPLACPVYGCALADCKFAMKRPTYGTICDTENFDRDVAQKFDAVCKTFKSDGVLVWQKRLILVTSEALRIITRMINQKRLGSKHPLMAGQCYVVCDVDSIVSLMAKARNQYKSATRHCCPPTLVF